MLSEVKYGNPYVESIMENDHVVFPLSTYPGAAKQRGNISVFQTRSQTNYDKHPGVFHPKELHT